MTTVVTRSTVTKQSQQHPSNQAINDEAKALSEDLITAS
jgi:hypothetical protein